jgi:hypothetical protein
MKKLIAASVFFLAALFGSMALGGGLGQIGPFLSFIISMLSFALMWVAVGMWKDAKKGKKDEVNTEDPPHSDNA